MAGSRLGKSLRIIFSSIFTLLLIGLFSLSLFVFYICLENRPPEPEIYNPTVRGIKWSEEGIYIEVAKGESLIALSERLYYAGLTRSARIWRLFPYLVGENIKAGDYLLSGPLPAIDIYRHISSGKTVLLRVTIPEGFTLKKTASRLENAGFGKSENFMALFSDTHILEKYNIPAENLEGYLFPDTYYFPRNYPEEKIVEELVASFFKVLTKDFPQSLEEDPEKRHERVILASIVEREAYLKNEAPLIAGVFYNRLQVRMPLQSCATVEYILTEFLGRPHPERLYDADIAIDHSYNTYINRGLPPGPIASPGRTALAAVYRPEASDYLYFRLVDSKQGSHAFSRTYDQHLEYGLLYRPKEVQSP